MIRGLRRLGAWPGVLAATGVGLGLYGYLERTKASRMEAPKGMSSIGELKLGGPFTLTDQQGKVRTNDSFKGKYLLIYFGFAHCPDFCPMELKKLGAVVDSLEPDLRNNVQVIMISVDPARDTPEKLATYAKDYHPGFLYLTGEPDAIMSVAQSYRVYFQKPDNDDPYYQVDHSLFTYMTDMDGKVVQYFGNHLTADEVAAKIREFDQSTK